MHARLVKVELAFVDHQAGIDFARRHRGDDLVERQDFGFKIGFEQLQR